MNRLKPILVKYLGRHLAISLPIYYLGTKDSTLPTAEILSGKNARVWVSMVLHLKN